MFLPFSFFSDSQQHGLDDCVRDAAGLLAPAEYDASDYDALTTHSHRQEDHISTFSFKDDESKNAAGLLASDEYDTCDHNALATHTHRQEDPISTFFVKVDE